MEGSLGCPRCRGALRKTEFADQLLLACPRCRGVWCGPGQLAELEGTKRDLPASEVDCEPVDGKACPTCPMPIQLDQRPYMDGSKLRVDVCPSCHGVWLDPGELKQVMKLRPQRLADERADDEAVLRALGAVHDFGKVRVLKSNYKHSCATMGFLCGGFLGWLATGSVLGGLAGAVLAAWLGTYYWTQHGWFTFLGPFKGWFGGIRLHSARRI